MLARTIVLALSCVVLTSLACGVTKNHDCTPTSCDEGYYCHPVTKVCLHGPEPDASIPEELGTEDAGPDLADATPADSTDAAQDDADLTDANDDDAGSGDASVDAEADSTSDAS